MQGGCSKPISHGDTRVTAIVGLHWWYQMRPAQESGTIARRFAMKKSTVVSVGLLVMFVALC